MRLRGVLPEVEARDRRTRLGAAPRARRSCPYVRSIEAPRPPRSRAAGDREIVACMHHERRHGSGRGLVERAREFGGEVSELRARRAPCARLASSSRLPRGVSFVPRPRSFSTSGGPEEPLPILDQVPRMAIGDARALRGLRELGGRVELGEQLDQLELELRSSSARMRHRPNVDVDHRRIIAGFGVASGAPPASVVRRLPYSCLAPCL